MLSRFFNDREEKLQRRKGGAAKRLRTQLARQERRCTKEVKSWFYKEITRKLVRGIRKETPRFYGGMFELSRLLRGNASSSLTGIQADLNSRLFRRCGEFVGGKVSEETISASIARDPRIRAKCVGSASRSFCQKVGRALDGRIGVQKQGPMEEMIAEALHPATVDPMKISLDQQGAVVRLPKGKMGRATGKQGNNVQLAERLLRTPIRLREDNEARP